jgi:predicted O-methyltransferase YrrM
MSNQSIGIDPPLYQYLLDVSLREDPVLAELRAVTAELPQRNMQIAPEQGQFMAMLARLIGARRYIEIGTFTGYSTLAVARAMPDDAEIIACDVSREWTDIAQRFWHQAGVAERIRLALQPALDTLDELVGEGRTGHFDLAFIDADKTGYIDYFERCLRLIRPGGLILVDNTLWGGSVINPEKNDDDTEAIRSFNRHVHDHDGVDLSLVPIGDGLTLLRRRAG